MCIIYNFGSGQRAREIVGNRQKDSQGGRRAGGDFCGCPPPQKYNRSPLDIGYTSHARHTTHTRPRRAAKAQFTWADADPPGSRRVPPEGDNGSRARASWRVEGRAPAAPQRRSSRGRAGTHAARGRGRHGPCKDGARCRTRARQRARALVRQQGAVGYSQAQKTAKATPEQILTPI